MNRFTTLKFIVLFLAAGFGFASCNKDVPTPTPLINSAASGTTIGDIVNTDANFSYLKVALTRTGMLTALQNKDARFTVFAPDNTAFNRLFAGMGLPQAEATINALPIATLTGILQYHVLPGQVITGTTIPETFPNVSMPTMIQAVPTNPLLKLMNFPSRRGTSAFVDNIPVAQADIPAANGVIHRMVGVIVPPNTGATVMSALSADTSYSFLVAAINRADLALPAANKISTLLSTASPYANFTLFAPNNNAFRTLFRSLGVLNPTVSSIDLLSFNTCISVVAYHVMIRGVLNPTTNPTPDLVRVFSTNLPATATTTPTFLNMLSPSAPRLTISAVGVKGTGNPVTGSFTKTDTHVLNGVYHGINMVLIPQ